MARAKKNPNPPSQDPEVQQLKKDWPALDPYAKGDRLLPLRRRYTLTQLAKELGCSRKRLRDFEELANLRGSQREEARKLGVKRVLDRIRKNRKTWGRWQRQTRGRSLKDRLAKQLREWMHQNLEEVQWEPFFQQVFHEGCAPGEVKKFAPHRWDELQFEGDWQKVIDSTKPSGNPKDPRKYDSMLGYYVQWFATWYTRCMPFDSICEAVARRVRLELRREAWDRYGYDVNWTFPPPWI